MTTAAILTVAAVVWSRADSTHHDGSTASVDTEATATSTTSRAAPSTTTTTPATTTTTSTPASSVSELSAQAAELAEDRVGAITAAVYDATTDQTVTVNPGAAPQDTASIMKVDILATTLAAAQAAGRELTDSQQDLATSMIEQSNNDSAQALWNAVGGAPAIAATDQRVGMTSTTPDTAGYWGLSTTTALDQIRLLRAVAYPNSFLTTASQDYELNLMEHVESDQAWGDSAGVPSGVTLAVKNGWLQVGAGWQINSLGYVNGQGRDYVIAVLTTGNPTEGYGISTIEDLSKLVWNDLGPA